MAATAGLGSYWTINWLPCTPVVVQKVAQTRQVIWMFSGICFVDFIKFNGSPIFHFQMHSALKLSAM